VTETTTKRSIAETIRYSRRPEGEMADLSAQAGRLKRSLDVASKWIDATMEGNVATELTAHAETTHDQLEEELSRVVYQMEELARQSECKGLGHEDVPEGVIDSALLSDTLLEAYCVLAAAPENIFGVGGAEASARTRYKLMGALLVAQDAANAEVARGEG